jgi:hypothetical protein
MGFSEKNKGMGSVIYIKMPELTNAMHDADKFYVQIQRGEQIAAKSINGYLVDVRQDSYTFSNREIVTCVLVLNDPEADDDRDMELSFNMFTYKAVSIFNQLCRAVKDSYEFDKKQIVINAVAGKGGDKKLFGISLSDGKKPFGWYKSNEEMAKLQVYGIDKSDAGKDKFCTNALKMIQEYISKCSYKPRSQGGWQENADNEILNDDPFGGTMASAPIQQSENDLPPELQNRRTKPATFENKVVENFVGGMNKADVVDDMEDIF